jgi:RNA polymerase sigma-70 factor (ECF subfamily)
MNTTPASLLDRLRQPAGQEAWNRFVNLYTPLLYYWARRDGLQEPDAADVVQDVLLLLIRKLPEFNYDRGKSFRNWLRTVTLNKLRERRRRQGDAAPINGADLDDLADPDPAIPLGETEYRQYLARRALQLMQSEFQPNTWKACWETLVAGRSAGEVAAELGISEAAVYVAKSRVLHRLREELRGLLE